MEKYVFSHAAGAAAVIDASLVKVTVRGLFEFPLGPTVTGVVRVCAVPDDDVVKAQITSLGELAMHPVSVVRSDEDV